jgi:hypothetical protein
VPAVVQTWADLLGHDGGGPDRPGSAATPDDRTDVLFLAILGTVRDSAADRLRAGQARQRVIRTAARVGWRTWGAVPRPGTVDRPGARQRFGGAVWPQQMMAFTPLAEALPSGPAD